MTDKLAVVGESEALVKLTPDIVRKYVCKLATDEEIFVFLQQCALFNLNPFKREIYLIKYDQKEKAQAVVGFEAFIRRAELSLRLNGWNCVTVGDPGDEANFKAVVTIHRKDWAHPFVHECYFNEYAQFKNEWVNGRMTGAKVLTKFWAEKRRTMIKKVTISQGFRLCFPEELGGMPYTAEEMPAGAEPLPSEPIEVEVVKGGKADVKVVEAEVLPGPPSGKHYKDGVLDDVVEPVKGGDYFKAVGRLTKEWEAGADPLGILIEAQNLGIQDCHMPDALVSEAKKKVSNHAAEAKRQADEAFKTPPEKPKVKKAPTAAAKPPAPETAKPDASSGDIARYVEINRLVKVLDESYGRDPDQLVNGKDGILARVRKGHGTNPKKIEDLLTAEADWVIKLLNMTVANEQSRVEAEMPTDFNEGPYDPREDER